MAMALLGYAASMLAVLSVLMVLAGSFIASSPVKTARRPPHPLPVMGQSAPVENKLGQWGPAVAPKSTDVAAWKAIENVQSTDTARPAAAVRAAADKNKRLRLAQRRKVRLLARQREVGSYPTALGYDQERAYGSPFGSFEARSF